MLFCVKSDLKICTVGARFKGGQKFWKIHPYIEHRDFINYESCCISEPDTHIQEKTIHSLIVLV
jgi:hypothetical protein